MLLLLVAAAAHSTENSGSEEKVYRIVDGGVCFPPLGLVKSAILIILTGSLVIFVGTSFIVMFRFCRHLTQPQECTSWPARHHLLPCV
jgi:hypothetical protein